MSIEILSSLSAKLLNAHQIFETVVLQTNEGAVFTIEIGKSILPGENSSIGAKVTLMTNPPTHIGICEGETVKQVSTAAQELIATAISDGVAIASKSVVPKPHMTTAPKVSA